MDQKSGYPPGSGPPNPTGWTPSPPPGWSPYPPGSAPAPQQGWPQHQIPGGPQYMPSAPPTYEEACKNQPQNYGAAQGLPPMQQHPQQMPMGYPSQYGQPYPQPGPYKNEQVVGQFDAGVRFTPYAPPTIPPPPPGCAPNAAQIAASQGQRVEMEKKSGGFFNGTGSGGYTFW